MDIHKYIRSKNRSYSDALNEYASYSEEQLMAELFKKGSLSTGNVSAEELDEFYEKALPFLTNEQAEKMRSLILNLKNS